MENNKTVSKPMEIIGRFEFMGKEICDVTEDNYNAIKIIKTALDNLLTKDNLSPLDIREEINASMPSLSKMEIVLIELVLQWLDFRFYLVRK